MLCLCFGIGKEYSGWWNREGIETQNSTSLYYIEQCCKVMRFLFLFLILFISQTLTPTPTCKPDVFWETKNIVFQYSSNPRGDWKSSCLPSGKTDSASPVGKRGLWRSVWRDSSRHLRGWKWRNQSSSEGNVDLLIPWHAGSTYLREFTWTKL